MHPFNLMLAAIAAAAMIGFVYVLRWERRKFLARGLGGSWLRVRLCSIPATIVVAVLVMIPARSTAGMEGLAVFYGLLFTAAPVFWFGIHWVVGRLSRPQLAFADSARIAGSPLIYALAVALVAPRLQSLAWSLSRSL